MAKEYKFIHRWQGQIQQASGMNVGVCEEGGTVGFDMLAVDQSIFAHGHFDLAGAKLFASYLQRAIDTLEKEEEKNKVEIVWGPTI